MDKNQQTENGVKTAKRAWLYAVLSGGVLLFAAVIVLVVLAVNGAFVKTPTLEGEDPVVSGDQSSGNGDDDDDVNTGTTVSFVNPMSEMNVLNEQGFFYNSTLNCYIKKAESDMTPSVSFLI